MFGIGYSELLVIAIIALVVIGPKDLPRVMREVGRWVGKAQGMARHFRSGIDTMIREAELEEMEKKWREENERIMRDHPLVTPGAEMMPLAGPPAEAAPSTPAAAEPPTLPDWSSAAAPAAPAEAPAGEAPPAAGATAPATDPSAPELPLALPATAPPAPQSPPGGERLP